MAWITAETIFDGYKFLPKNTVLDITSEGIIKDIFQTNTMEGVRRYDGLLMPGMVNAHCHLELSHMKGKVEAKKGLVPFLLSVLSNREKYTAAEKQTAIESGEAEMIQNGIVAVGDICNGLDTLLQKRKKNLVYHSFVECFGLRAERGAEIFAAGKKIQEEYEKHGRSSLVLHAPYSISNTLIKYVDEDSVGKICTIHNQECAEENELFFRKSGSFLKLFDAIHFDKSDFEIENKSSIQTYLPKFIHQQKIILVHNTFASEEDIVYANALGKELYWCVCAKANLYIEDRLPDIEMMVKNHCEIVLGTDSLASNDTLNIWEEIKAIHKHKPKIPIARLLQWATSNGARALGLEDEIGSLSVGKRPGVANIALFDLNERVVRSESVLVRIY